MHIGFLVTWAAVSIAVTAPAHAATRIQTGVGPGGMTWTATSNVVGQTSTGTTPPRGSPGGGDPIYLAPNSAGYSGVVGVRMNYASGRNLVCSGSLVGDRSVVTAGHCVSDGGGAVSDSLVRTQVFFQNAASSERDERVYGVPSGNPSSDVTVIDVSDYVVNADYTGNVVDQNDIAVLTLANVAPAFAQRYDIYTANLSGMAFNVAGYGARSDIGGAEGVRPPAGTATGYRRQGDNVYDFAWGDAAFGGFFTDRDPEYGYGFFGPADVEYSFVADFDDGSRAQDASCMVAQYAGVSAADADALGFCTTGLGPREVSIASGDSGGGAFIDGRLASVNSYGLSFGAEFGISDEFDASFGSLTGYVPIFIHADFIRNAIASAVPEPATWAQLLLGFGMIGIATRRRRRSVAPA